MAFKNIWYFLNLRISYDFSHTSTETHIMMYIKFQKRPSFIHDAGASHLSFHFSFLFLISIFIFCFDLCFLKLIFVLLQHIFVFITYICIFAHRVFHFLIYLHFHFYFLVVFTFLISHFMFAILVLPAWNGRYLNWHEERYQGDKKKVQLSELITLYNYTFIALL